jgi:hypothetical protein
MSEKWVGKDFHEVSINGNDCFGHKSRREELKECNIAESGHANEVRIYSPKEHKAYEFLVYLTTNHADPFAAAINKAATEYADQRERVVIRRIASEIRDLHAAYKRNGTDHRDILHLAEKLEKEVEGE